MTFKCDNVYVSDASTVVGPYEKKGPLGNQFDKSYEDLYEDVDTIELAEIKLMRESVDILLEKVNKEKTDLFIAGDLQNQITSSSYAANELGFPYLGVFNACATNVEGMIIGSSMIDSGKINNAIISVSSHNTVSERQFRNPVEYGAPKPRTATFTATGGASIMLSKEKSKIKVESCTIGSVVDMDQNDPMHMGANMAGAAADTIYKHLTSLGRNVDYYDLILTGDLGLFGRDILIDYMNKEYKIDLSKNYTDSGIILYDLTNQKDVKAGGSGPVCNALVMYSDILSKMKSGKLKKVLLVATGALFNPSMVFQKQNITSIAHAISLEALK